MRKTFVPCHDHRAASKLQQSSQTVSPSTNTLSFMHDLHFGSLDVSRTCGLASGRLGAGAESHRDDRLALPLPMACPVSVGGGGGSPLEGCPRLVPSRSVGGRASDHADRQVGPSLRASLTNGFAGTAAISSAGHGASSGRSTPVSV